MKEELDLVKILKNVPIGTKLYHVLCGEVTLFSINIKNGSYPIVLECSDKRNITVTKNGRHLFNYTKGECVLFPSKTQRDWNKFIAPLAKDTPVMVSDNKITWQFRYYCCENKAYVNGCKSIDDSNTVYWKYIIPVNEFDFNNTETCLDKNIVK